MTGCYVPVLIHFSLYKPYEPCKLIAPPIYTQGLSQKSKDIPIVTGLKCKKQVTFESSFIWLQNFRYYFKMVSGNFRHRRTEFMLSLLLRLTQAYWEICQRNIYILILHKVVNLGLNNSLIHTWSPSIWRDHVHFKFQ